MYIKTYIHSICTYQCKEEHLITFGYYNISQKKLIFLKIISALKKFTTSKGTFKILNILNLATTKDPNPQLFFMKIRFKEGFFYC